MSKALGEKTLEVFRFVASYIDLHGYAPSYRQIGKGCGLSSTSQATYHLKRLEAAGYLAREKGIPRALVVLKDGVPRVLDELKEYSDHA